MIYCKLLPSPFPALEHVSPTLRCSLSKSSAASALASSVLPTPVGPAKRKEPAAAVTPYMEKETINQTCSVKKSLQQAKSNNFIWIVYLIYVILWLNHPQITESYINRSYESNFPRRFSLTSPVGCVRRLKRAAERRTARLTAAAAS